VCRMTVSGKVCGTPPRPAVPVPPSWVGIEGAELVPASSIGEPYSVEHAHSTTSTLLLQLDAIARPSA